jgi:hypothetical protein
MPRRVPDISKICSYIQWEPRIQLDEIIKRVVDYYFGLKEEATADEIPQPTLAEARLSAITSS